MSKINKRISGIVIAMSIFTCSSLFAFAAVDNAPESRHTHKYSIHRHVGSEYLVHEGPHTYLEGYDSQGNEIYKNDCTLSSVYIACEMECEIKSCTAIQSGSRHRDFIRFEHSKDHD